MTVVYLICAGLLCLAAVLAVVRAERGPSMLNRAVSLDVFATVVVGGIALEAAWSRRLDTLPILVAMSMVGFISSTVIARFASVEPESERRIRTLEEVAAEDARRRAEEEAADEAKRHAASLEAASSIAGALAVVDPTGAEPAAVEPAAEPERPGSEEDR